MDTISIKKNTRQAFTLIEVMIAIGILALGLTTIFSSEMQAIKVSYRSRKINIATLLARCKMEELEEHLYYNPPSIIDEKGEDNCCKDSEIKDFYCSWSLEKIIFPEDNTQKSSTDINSLLKGNINKDETKEEDSSENRSDHANDKTENIIDQIALNTVFPMIRGVIQERVRRANVKVTWKEGKQHSFEIVQFLVIPLRTGSQ